VIRQGRDVPAILQKRSAPIRRELIEIRASIERGEITWPTRSGTKARRKKFGHIVPCQERDPRIAPE
jgi:hypothetical protein